MWLCISASDAQGQLYISTDENPANKVMIAEISGDRFSLPREYTKYDVSNK